MKKKYKFAAGRESTHMDDIGQVLARLCKEKGLTQVELGKQVGTTDNYIGDLEHGKQGSVALFAKLSVVLGVPLEQLYRKGWRNGEAEAR